MAPEEHVHCCDYSGGASICSSSSNSRSKKVKQKKVPQRGLGVAQLERIRVEELKKKDALEAANVLAIKAIDDHTNHPIQCPKFRHSPNLEALHGDSSVQIPKQLGASGVELGLDENPSLGNSNWSRLWSSEYNVGNSNHGFAFRPLQVNEPNPCGPVLPLPGVPQRSHRFQQAFSFPSMVNVTTGILPSSVLSSQLEPPSNQSSCGNNFSPFWPDEDKMVGMKRSYPFSLESHPAPSFNCNFRPAYAPSISTSDDLASCNNQYASQTGPRNKHIREGPSNSNPVSEQNRDEAISGEMRLNGDFLTLAPPEVAISPLSNSKNMNYLDCSSEIEYMVHQENVESYNHQFGQSGSIEQSFTFFPMKLQMDQNTPQVSSGNGEKGETIDLNLKL